MLSDVGGWGVSECSRRPIFIFFIKENWICAITRHHSDNILLARNLPFDADVRQWNHPLMILLHCLWAKSNNRTRRQFEYDVTFFFFFLWFCSFACTGRLLFHSLFTLCKLCKWNRLIAKWALKKTFFKKTFRDAFGQLHTEECKATKK